uniref:Putative secreted protein n=1 Tax=Ixodes scapularis TaxID=6945 RepID=A0A4D5RBR1_IXOSC
MTKSNCPCLLFLLVFTQWKAVNVHAVTFSCLTEASEIPQYFLYNLSVTGCTLSHFWKLSEKQKWTTAIRGTCSSVLAVPLGEPASLLPNSLYLACLPLRSVDRCIYYTTDVIFLS